MPTCLVNVIAFAMAVLQTLISLKQTRESRKSTKEVQSQLLQLDEIRQGLSTQFLGQFPDYFRKVVNIVEQAEKEIVILSPFPSVACFSSPDSFLSYQHAIERKTFKAEGVSVSVTCQTRERRLQRAKEQFSKQDQDWENWKKENIDLLKRFLYSYGPGMNIESCSNEELIELLESVDQQLATREFSRTKYIETESEIPIYFWVVDEKIAVFAIAAITDAHNSLGFLTTDQKLISAFKDVSIRYRDKIAR